MDTIVFTPSEQEALRYLGVTGVILFGLQARGIAGEASDYDIGVIRVSHDAVYEKDLYDGLYDMLSRKIGKLVNIDIVFLDAAPLELQMHVARYGNLLFEVKRGVFATFKETMMIQYANFAPYRRMFQEQLLRRIPS